MSAGAAPNVRIGFAMNPKKSKNFLEPFSDFLTSRGVQHVVFDLNHLSLEVPHDIDVLVHKITDFMASVDDPKSKECIQAFNRILERFPNAVLLDDPACIAHCLHRSVMYEKLENAFRGKERVHIPRCFTASSGADAVQLRTKLGMRFPLLVKSEIACGRSDTHDFVILSTEPQLEACALTVPFVVQEFVNHGGIVYKVYVVHDHVWANTRRSIRDLQQSESICTCFNSQHEFPDLLANVADLSNPVVDAALLAVFADIAKSIHSAFGLHLFGFDVLIPSRDASAASDPTDPEQQYLVVDVNYFPSYKKTPNIYAVLLEFTSQLIATRRRGRPL
eukprot:ANDGO_02305.mRNA.1 Inositol-tetrakisphosphate 1-kinase 1